MRNKAASYSVLLAKWLLLSVTALLAGLVFSWRAFMSCGILALLAGGIAASILRKKINGPQPGESLLLLAATLQFLVPLLLFPINDGTADGTRQLVMKAALPSIVVALLLNRELLAGEHTRLLYIYCLLLFSAAIYCIGHALSRYSMTGQATEFFYHTLVSPLRHHAVYMAVLTAIAFCWLMYLQPSNSYQRWAKTALLIFLGIFLLLLSSRLVLAVVTLYWIVLFMARATPAFRVVATLGIIALLLLTIFTNNPLSDRFRDLARGETAVLGKKQFSAGEYFNGFRFRQLQWRLVPNIVTETGSWWTGTGPGHSQQLLEKKYRSLGMYTGDIQSGSTGYTLYNAHNQWLEALLKCGLPGLLAFALLMLALLRLALIYKNNALRFTVLLLCCFSCTESMLETQYGILVTGFFPLFFARRKPTD